MQWRQTGVLGVCVLLPAATAPAKGTGRVTEEAKEESVQESVHALFAVHKGTLVLSLGHLAVSGRVVLVRRNEAERLTLCG